MDNNLINFQSVIDVIKELYYFLKSNFNHKKLLGGCFGIEENKIITGGHALSYHICEDDSELIKIVLCDPNALDTCQIIYDERTQKVNLYDKRGVFTWDKVYFYEVSFLLVNTNYSPT